VKLYDDANALNTRRVRIFLAEKGITVPVETVSLEDNAHRQPAFLAKNPLGALPVLELDDGEIITESMAICRYFEDIQPDPSLFGSTALTRARIEMWNRRVEIEIMRPLQEVFRNTHDWWKGRVTQMPEYGAVCRDVAEARLAWLEEEMADRPYVAGDAYSVADISAYCAILLGRVSDIRLTDAHPNLSRWFAAMRQRPTAKA
jgi:glutathione S-transferase